MGIDERLAQIQIKQGGNEMKTLHEQLVEKSLPFIEAYQYNAELDDKTTMFCEEHHEQIIKQSDPEFGSINPPNHFNCRSILIPIMIGDADNPQSYYYNYEDEFKPFGTDVSVTKPADGFGG